MTYEEFREAVNKLMLELNKDEMRYNIFVYTVDIKTMTGYPSGMGCGACCAKRIAIALVCNELQHNTKSETHLASIVAQ